MRCVGVRGCFGVVCGLGRGGLGLWMVWVGSHLGFWVEYVGVFWGCRWGGEESWILCGVYGSVLRLWRMGKECFGLWVECVRVFCVGWVGSVLPLWVWWVGSVLRLWVWVGRKGSGPVMGSLLGLWMMHDGAIIINETQLSVYVSILSSVIHGSRIMSVFYHQWDIVHCLGHYSIINETQFITHVSIRSSMRHSSLHMWGFYHQSCTVSCPCLFSIISGLGWFCW